MIQTSEQGDKRTYKINKVQSLQKCMCAKKLNQGRTSGLSRLP